MRIIVDADAMPSIPLIENIARRYGLPCILISDDTHELRSNYSEVVTVTKGFQSVDMYLVNMITPGDIVISQDYGVAVLGLAKQCYVIHPKGFCYTKEHIDSMLAGRHMASKMRKHGHHTKGPKRRTKEDEERLMNTLIKQIEQEMK
ncbi:MAG: YaiI/YqxD family protein [Bacilli bacterium]|jgi:uncharacterized protein YaiI (UPF0178 family)|nr:YaiI/YqxD family protein [Bacilli bacterium]